MAEGKAEQYTEVAYLPLLTAVCIGGLLAPLNSTMIAVGLPAIRDEFTIGHAEIAWLASVYLIAMAVTQPIGGRMGDQLGRSLVYRGGLAAFLVASLLAAVAPNYALLMVFRTAQSIAGAVVIPNGLAMLRESVPGRRFGRSTGILSTASALAAAIGPLLGALILTAGSWRLLFLVNLPLVAIAFGAHSFLRYASRRSEATFRLDVPGVLAFAVLLAVLTLFLGSLRSGGLLLAGPAIAGALLLAGFIWRQRQSRWPIAEWPLFRIRGFSGASSYILLNTLVMYTLLLTVPFFTEELQGRESIYGGAILGLHAICMAVGAPIGGRLSDGLGRRPPVVMSSLLLLGGSGFLAVAVSRDMGFALLAAPLAVIGIGLGMGHSAASAAAIEAAPRSLAGGAAGTSSMMRWLGAVLGIALLGTILNTGDDGAPGLALFRAVFLVLTAASAAACVFAMMVHRHAEGDEAAVGERPAVVRLT